MKVSPVTLLRRIIAYGIDWYLATMICGIPLMLVNSISSGSTAIDTSLPDGTEGWLWGSAAILLGICYYWLVPLFWNGMTPGKKLLHLRIVSAADGSKPSDKALFLRQVIGVILIEGAIAFPSQLLRELFARITGENVMSVIQTIMVVITIISISIGMYSRQRRMIHDLISGTIEICELNE